jgi:hypothetical protein
LRGDSYRLFRRRAGNSLSSRGRSRRLSCIRLLGNMILGARCRGLVICYKLESDIGCIYVRSYLESSDIPRSFKFPSFPILPYSCFSRATCLDIMPINCGASWALLRLVWAGVIFIAIPSRFCPSTSLSPLELSMIYVYTQQVQLTSTVY